MAALHHLGEQGGWPLTMFLTPDGEPFWGGTYFPKESRYGRPAFADVLREVARLFREEPEQASSSNRTRPDGAAGRSARGRRTGDDRPRTSSTSAARQLAGAIDPINGGLRGAPKFPQAADARIPLARWHAQRRRALLRSRRH